MKNIFKFLIVSLTAMSLSVANAGELSISGDVKASYSVTSGDGTAGGVNTNPGLGISNEFSLKASGELDNGIAWSYAQDIDDATVQDDASIALTGGFGTVKICVSECGLGSDNAASQSVISRPSDTSYAEAMSDTYEIDGFNSIQYHSPADLLPLGITFKVGYAPSTVANANSSYKAAGSSNDQVASADSAAAGGITLDAGGKTATHYRVDAAPIDGLKIGADYFETSSVVGSPDQKPESGAYYATYAAGPATIGYNKSYAALGVSGISDVVEYVENTKYSIAFNVNDNLSISYENEESEPNTTANSTTYTLESTGVQATYTMGGMTLGVAHNEHENAAYTENKDVKDTVFSLVLAF